MPRINDLAKRADNICLKLKIHSQIRIVPFAENTQAFEILTLTIHLFLRVRATGFTKSSSIDFCSGLANLFFHIEFDGQTMTIPAWHIRRIKAAEGFGFNNDVFQHLVHRMADMNITISVGWAIVQDKFFPTFTLRAQLLIQTCCFPFLQHIRLAFGQISTHGKIGLRQVQGRLVVVRLAHVRASLIKVKG